MVLTMWLLIVPYMKFCLFDNSGEKILWFCFRNLVGKILKLLLKRFWTSKHDLEDETYLSCINRKNSENSEKSKYAMVMLPSLLSSTLPRNVIGRVDFVCFVCCLQHPAWGRNKTYYQYQTCFLNSLNLWNNCTLKIVVANIVLNRRAGRLLCCVCLCVCCVVWILGEDEVST